jgi:hypothetical protein
VSLPLLATAEQLASVLQQDLDRATAELALATASGKVRAYTRQRIDLVTGETIDLEGYVREVLLPQRPVVEDNSHTLTVTEVSSLGLALPTLQAYRDYIRIGQRLIRTAGAGWDALVGYPMGIWQPTVRVTYSHGYATIPDEIVGVVLDLASRIYNNPKGLRSVTVDDYTRVYANETIGVAELTDANKKALAAAGFRLRARSMRLA